MAPAILDAIVRANEGYARGYGSDDWTKGVEQALAGIFERDVAVFLVPTGTAANALALAHVTPPWGVVFCHNESHIITDECGAPEFFGHGLRLCGLFGEAGKLAPALLQDALSGYGGHSPHQMVAHAVSITQASEAGTVYRPDEIAALCEIAHGRGLAVHMDGARFGNALVRLNTTPAQLTWQSGIDVLSFGATKGGALAAEAVVFFDPARAAAFGERRKRSGHLISKHRFVAAQLAAYLADGTWLRLARHANAMADRLAQNLAAIGLPPLWPVDANLVFIKLPRALDAKLQGGRRHLLRAQRAPCGVEPDDAFGAARRLVRHHRGGRRSLCRAMQSRLTAGVLVAPVCRSSHKFELRPSAAPIPVDGAGAGCCGQRGRHGVGQGVFCGYSGFVVPVGQRPGPRARVQAGSQGPSQASPSQLPRPVTGFVSSYEIMRAVRPAGLRSAGAAAARRHHLRAPRHRLSRHSDARRGRCPQRRDPRCQPHRARPGLLWSGRFRALSGTPAAYGCVGLRRTRAAAGRSRHALAAPACRAMRRRIRGSRSQRRSRAAVAAVGAGQIRKPNPAAKPISRPVPAAPPLPPPRTSRRRSTI